MKLISEDEEPMTRKGQGDTSGLSPYVTGMSLQPKGVGT